MNHMARIPFCREHHDTRACQLSPSGKERKTRRIFPLRMGCAPVGSFLGLRSIDDELDTSALTFEEEGALNLGGGFIPEKFALGTSLIARPFLPKTLSRCASKELLWRIICGKFFSFL
jgi:hypothetical protein